MSFIRNQLHQVRRLFLFGRRRTFTSMDQNGAKEKGRRWKRILGLGTAAVATVVGGAKVYALGNASAAEKKPEEKEDLSSHHHMIDDLPIEKAVLTYAPKVPPPIRRNYPVKLLVEIETKSSLLQISQTHKYPVWTFGETVPGPFIRCRVGDVVEFKYKNNDETGIGHNIDFHAVTGPGGGAPALYAEQGEVKTGTFRMLTPGLYIYHCAAAPVCMHIANGMYGLLLVEPEAGLPKVDKEFYVLQSEFYGEESSEDRTILEPSYNDGLDEKPIHVLLNGKEGALTENPLMVDQGDRVRIFFGNAGPNLISSFHIIGTVFDYVYREGDLISPPARGVQTTMVPAGGSCVVEMDAVVPGNYTLVDHSIFRLEKGCVGFLKVKGSDPHHEIYRSGDMPIQCPGCKLHN